MTSEEGELTVLSPATISGGSEPEGVIISPDGKHLYVGHHHEEDVRQYSIGEAGALTALSPASVASAKWPLDGQVSPDGKFLYVASELSTEAESFVQVYAIGEAGLLVEVQKLAFAKAEPHGVKLSPDGKFLYVPGYFTASVYVFARNEATGHVTLVSTLSGLGGKAKAIDFTPDGKYAYIAEATIEGKVAQCSRNAETGALTLLSPSSVAAGEWVEWVAVSPDGKHLYASNEAGGLVYQFAIESGGTLKALTTPTVACASGGIQLIVSPDGKSVYVACQTEGKVQQYARHAETGQLTALKAATVTSGAGCARLAITPNGSYVYVANTGTSTLAQFSRYATAEPLIIDAATASVTAASRTCSVLMGTYPGATEMMTAAGSPELAIIQGATAATLETMVPDASIALHADARAASADMGGDAPALSLSARLLAAEVTMPMLNDVSAVMLVQGSPMLSRWTAIAPVLGGTLSLAAPAALAAVACIPAAALIDMPPIAAASATAAIANLTTQLTSPPASLDTTTITPELAQSLAILATTAAVDARSVEPILLLLLAAHTAAITVVEREPRVTVGHRAGLVAISSTRMTVVTLAAARLAAASLDAQQLAHVALKETIL